MSSSSPAADKPAPLSLFRAFATVGGYTMLSRITGLLREVLMANFIGAGPVADAFFFAFRFPNLFRALFAEGAFNQSFVPIFGQILARDGKREAKRFADETFAVLTVVLIVFCAVVVVAMPQIMAVIAQGFADIPGQIARTTELTRIMFPYLLFVSLTSQQSGMLNAIGRFAVPAAAPVLLNVVFIAALLLGVGAHGNRTSFLAWGVLISGLVQFAWLAMDCRRVGLAITPVRPRLTADVKTLLVRILPMTFGAGIYQFNVLVNSSVATFVGPGAVAWIAYADRVNLLPVGIFGTAIGIALLPVLVRHIQSGDEAAALHDQNRAIEISLLLTVPASAGIAMLAGPITSVLFERGAFTPHDRVMVAHALLAFSLGLPAYVLNKALTPGFFGRHDTRGPVIASTIAMVVNVAINLALMHSLGHVGIALGTSVSAWCNVTILWTMLHRRGHLRLDARLTRRLPRIVLASVVMMGALWFALELMDRYLGAAFGTDTLPGIAFGLRTLILAVLIGLGGGVYAVSAWAIGAAEAKDLGSLRRRSKAATPASNA